MSLKTLCAGAGPAIRKVVHQIDDGLAKISEEVVLVTGKLKGLETNPAVEAIVGIIPGGSAIEGWIDKALTLIYGAGLTGENVAAKIKFILDNVPTELAKNKELVKIASVATSVGDGNRKSESLYDEATVLKIATLKGEAA